MILLVGALGLIGAVSAAVWQLVPIGRRLGDRPGDASSEVAVVRSGRPGVLVAAVTVDNPGTSSVLVGVEARGAWRLGILREPLSVWVPNPRRPQTPAGTMVGSVDSGESRTWRLSLEDFTSCAAINVVVNLYQTDSRRRVLTHRLSHDDLIGAVNLRGPGG